MDSTIITHDGALYSIIHSDKSGEFIVIKAKLLKNNKKLVDDVKIIPADDINHVKRIIRSGEIEKFLS